MYAVYTLRMCFSPRQQNSLLFEAEIFSRQVTSKSWVKMNGELNMLEIKSSTGRPVLAASIHNSNATRHKDDFGAPLEYCTFHFESTPNVNLCVAGPRMIDGGKIAKPALTSGITAAAVTCVSNEDKAADDEIMKSGLFIFESCLIAIWAIRVLFDQCWQGC